MVRRALGVVMAGERLFDCVQATWNLLEPSTGPALAEARAAGLGVIIKEALANGRLSARNDDPAFAAKRRRLEEMAARFGAGVDALALGAALACPWADVVLSGAATVDQLRSNLAALAIPWDDQAGEMARGLAESPEGYWNTRAGLPWN
jgi:aryl-alcohol dehydrogenase-like predicted oxidoreductase